MIDFKTPKDLRDFLLSNDAGETHMLYLQSQKGSFMQWNYKNGLQIKMKYPANKFSSIGVWWNHLGYPEEDGCRRNECAFEPIAGRLSSLIDRFKSNNCQFVEANDEDSWEIVWSVK